MIPSQTRESVRKAYPGQKWSEKVNRMNDQQVFAVYVRLKKQRRI